MRKYLALFMAIVVSLSLVACGKTDEETDTKKNSGGNTGKKPSFSVAMVTDSGGVNDKSFNQSTWEGLQKFAEDTGSFCNYAQSTSDLEYTNNLSTFVEDGADIVIAPGYLFEAAMKKVATDSPNSKFLIIDAEVKMPNVASALFAENEGGYLVGIAAAETARENGKNKVGFVGGAELAVIQKFEAGFVAGVKSVDPKMEILVDYVGGFSDVGKAQTIANDMYDKGAYVIFQAAGQAGNGVINVAKERCSNGDRVWVIGVDKDQYDEGLYDEGKSCVLTSSVKRADVAAYDVCMRTLTGDFPGGQTLIFDIKNGGIDLPKENPNLSQEVMDKISAEKDKIKEGKIEVPKIPERVSK